MKPLLFLSLLILVDGYDQVHRHRHSHSEYNLDRLMNRLDSITTQPPLSSSTEEPENSLWDDDFPFSSVSPLDMDRWDKIISEKEKQREDREDAEEEEQSEEEGFEDQKEQADSYRSWNSRSGESYSNWKWEQMGNRKSLDNLFQVYRSGLLKPDSTSKESQAQYEVYKHSKQMSRETLCRVPKPKVIKVSDVYPSTSKLYVPACTVLHQCGEDTGCCGGSAQRCGPKTTKRVELYFYTTYTVPSHSRRTSSGLEKLPFYNHTECECLDKLEEVMPRDGQNSELRGDRSSEQECKCPSEFTVRRLANGSCSCDCFDKQRDCIKYKKGKEYFNHNDRLCIEMGTCQLPVCDFGAYLRSSGRCPRKHEKFRSWSRY
ncbi:uncharacterized protein LOC128985384 [Macrosteles quadrilineatus]|uniref:uncharacterized protein LOC128985384 n=1 Tax=Macrosteles quadrilineatus TaxID=74068 RepID=UPI0023E18667|nr:uncharacterized protein LOC128985384 [Macrosteles quadrilineatus]